MHLTDNDLNKAQAFTGIEHKMGCMPCEGQAAGKLELLRCCAEHSLLLAQLMN